MLVTANCREIGTYKSTGTLNLHIQYINKRSKFEVLMVPISIRRSKMIIAILYNKKMGASAVITFQVG